MTMLANGGRPAARLITGAHQRTAGLYLALREAAASDTDLARRLREIEERRRVSAEQGLSLVAGRAVTGEERDGLWAVIVDAPVEAVWRVITDVTRTGEWSHECRQVAWLHGAAQAAPGVRFRGRNRSGLLRWSRVCEVIAVDTPREIAWRTIPTT